MSIWWLYLYIFAHAIPLPSAAICERTATLLHADDMIAHCEERRPESPAVLSEDLRWRSYQ